MTASDLVLKNPTLPDPQLLFSLSCLKPDSVLVPLSQQADHQPLNFLKLPL